MPDIPKDWAEVAECEDFLLAQRALHTRFRSDMGALLAGLESLDRWLLSDVRPQNFAMFLALPPRDVRGHRVIAIEGYFRPPFTLEPYDQPAKFKGLTLPKAWAKVAFMDLAVSAQRALTDFAFALRQEEYEQQTRHMSVEGKVRVANRIDRLQAAYLRQVNALK